MRPPTSDSDWRHARPIIQVNYGGIETMKRALSSIQPWEIAVILMAIALVWIIR
jgi:hypothetical protein